MSSIVISKRSIRNSATLDGEVMQDKYKKRIRFKPNALFVFYFGELCPHNRNIGAVFDITSYSMEDGIWESQPDVDGERFLVRPQARSVHPCDNKSDWV